MQDFEIASMDTNASLGVVGKVQKLFKMFDWELEEMESDSGFSMSSASTGPARSWANEPQDTCATVISEPKSWLASEKPHQIDICNGDPPSVVQGDFINSIEPKDTSQETNINMKLQQIIQAIQESQNRLTFEIKSEIMESKQYMEKMILDEGKAQSAVNFANQQNFRESLGEQYSELDSRITAHQGKTISLLQQSHLNVDEVVTRVGCSITEAVETLAKAVTDLSISFTNSQTRLMKIYEETVHNSILDIHRSHQEQLDTVLMKLHQALQQHEEKLLIQMENRDRNLHNVMHDFTTTSQNSEMIKCSLPQNSSHTATHYSDGKRVRVATHAKQKLTKSRKSSSRSSASGSSSSSSDTSSSSESDTDISRSDPKDNVKMQSGQTKVCNRRTPVKFWPFDGSEKWDVWHKRFEVGTKGWSDDEKLETMLELMDGTEARFIVDQLPAETQKNYNAVITELGKRFKLIKPAENNFHSGLNTCAEESNIHSSNKSRNANFESPPTPQSYQQFGNGQQHQKDHFVNTFQCYKCFGYNHIARNCPTKRPPRIKQSSFSRPNSIPIELLQHGGYLKESGQLNNVGTTSTAILKPQINSALHTQATSQQIHANRTNAVDPSLPESYSTLPQYNDYSANRITLQPQSTQNNTELQSPGNQDVNRLDVPLLLPFCHSPSWNQSRARYDSATWSDQGIPGWQPSHRDAG